MDFQPHHDSFPGGNQPSFEVPHGFPSAFTPDTPRARALAAVDTVFPVVAIICVAGRFWARSITKQAFGADDWLVSAALFITLGQAVTVALSLSNGGVGQHVSSITPSHMTLFIQLLTVIQFTFGVATGLSKMSICLFLIRIFAVPGFRRWAYLVLTYCGLWIVGVILNGVLLCRPFAFRWDHTIDGTCGSSLAAYNSIAVTDIVGDILIIALPMHHVWRNPSLSLVKKFELTALFSLGIVEIVVSVLRIVTLVQIDFDGDFTYEATGTYIFSVIEPCLGVIIACAPSLRPVVARCINASRGSYRGHGRSGSTPGLGGAGGQAGDRRSGPPTPGGQRGSDSLVRNKFLDMGRRWVPQVSLTGPSTHSYDRMDDEAFALSEMVPSRALSEHNSELAKSVVQDDVSEILQPEPGLNGFEREIRVQIAGHNSPTVMPRSPAALSMPKSPTSQSVMSIPKSPSPMLPKSPRSPGFRVRDL